MTLQNRVQPTGGVLAIPARGTLMGNRGILHDADQRLGVARWRHPHWISCELSFRGRHRAVMSPGAYTELFFLDEVTAMAAGHRVCAECRRAEYNAFRAAWGRAFGAPVRAGEMDRVLHAARVTRGRQQVRHEAQAQNLPDGACVLWDGRAHAVRGGALLEYTPEGYAGKLTLPHGPVTVLTPAPLVAILAAGYRPRWHESATRPAV
ncbi:hypothetical protein [Pseudooceanicola nanhaiensis]|uniref:hypothetical protein n=1 Tax=Pseudooceanicola nanhaiensis TaxID=375761 RepID=UPI001CD80FB7|nr:hypothetical protein [Pseudooceanicola nanhaiensis]MCA0921030.1 hypothetical protein [Pseudooceanicola nanhaiensis]